MPTGWHFHDYQIRFTVKMTNVYVQPLVVQNTLEFSNFPSKLYVWFYISLNKVLPMNLKRIASPAASNNSAIIYAFEILIEIWKKKCVRGFCLFVFQFSAFIYGICIKFVNTFANIDTLCRGFHKNQSFELHISERCEVTLQYKISWTSKKGVIIVGPRHSVDPL